MNITELRYLIQDRSKKLEDWFNKDTFDWRLSFMLAEHRSDEFEKWFNKDKYDYENDSLELVKYCSKYFDKWFDIDKFKFFDGSLEMLIKYCYNDFMN